MDRKNVQMLSVKKSNIPQPLEQDDKKSEVLKWGKYNEYPYYLKYLSDANPIHGGIVKSKVHFTVSGGLEYTGPNELGYQEFFKNRKRDHKDFNLQQIARLLSSDFEKSNLFALKVVFNAVGSKKYKKIEHIPFEQIRFEIAYDDENNVYLTGNIRIAKDWTDPKVKWETLKPYDSNDPDQRCCYVMHQEECGESLIPGSRKKINPGWYPSPVYAGAITDIDTLIEIGVYNNSEIHNGFSLGTLIYLANGQPKNEDDQRQLEMDLSASSTGGLQAGRSMVVYGNGQDMKPHIESLQGNNLPDRYANSKKGAEQSIIYAHEVVVPTLFGVKQEGSFNASELEIGYAIMDANYFEGRREAILSILNWIMNDIAGIQGELTFNRVELNLGGNVDEDEAGQTGKALNDMSPLVATKVLSSMTPNEIRALAKLKPREGGDELPEINQGQSSFTKEQSDKILDGLKKFGVDKNEFYILDSNSKFEATPEFEQEYLNEFKKTAFATLSDNEQQALNLIQENQGFNNIRKALDISGRELAGIYQVLIEKGLITKSGEVTTAGRRQIAINDVESMQIMYEYRLRADAPELVPGGESRNFCKILIELNRLYTREEIEAIGPNVFAYRGGWYHNPNTDKNEPGCRHEWSQVITFGRR